MVRIKSRIKENVTVRMAKEYLDSRRDNQRKLSERHVNELSDAMLNGRWIYNGDAIRFDVSGHMIDGQHRCAAGIKAGKSFLSDVVFGLPENAYYTIDQKAKNRSNSDVLKTHNEINTTALAAALAWHIAYEKSLITSSGKRLWNTPDSQQICMELNHHPDIRRSVLVGRKAHSLMAPGPLSCLHYIFSRIDETLADTFFNSLTYGEGLYQTDPVFHLRNILIEDRIQNKAKLPIGEKVAIIIKAWNLVRNNKTAKTRKSICWRSNGKFPEEFPIAK